MADPVLAGNVLVLHWMVTFAGQVITGARLSSTTMICIQEVLFPHPSVAVHVRVIVLSCGHPPATVASLKVTVGAAAQLSVAVAEPVLAGSVLAVHCMVTLAGQVIAGAWLSLTTMV